jgi:lipoprotein-anchoring transpeptidase ErfK/SrfK
MVRPVFVVALVASLALAGASLALTAASRARAQHVAAPTAADAPPRGLRPLAAVPAPRQATGATATAVPARSAPHHAAPPPAEVLRVRSGGTVALRDRPRGHVVAQIGDRTQFGSATALSVASRRARWAAVPSSALPNGRLGWVDTRDGALDRRTTDVRLSVSLSHRRLELRVRGKLVRKVPVAIGRPGSTTPTGRFSITDKMPGGRYGPYYGCCILALSGHQPNTPPGWTGGDRLAIHGTNAPSTVGTPASAGCLRAADQDLRVLMRRVPLGTPVVIHN